MQAYMQEQTPRSVMHAFEETDEHPDAPNKSLFGLHKVVTSTSFLLMYVVCLSWTLHVCRSSSSHTSL